MLEELELRDNEHPDQGILGIAWRVTIGDGLPQPDPEVIARGSTVAISMLSKDDTETVVARVRADTAKRIDWSWQIGGRAVVKTLAEGEDFESVMRAWRRNYLQMCIQNKREDEEVERRHPVNIFDEKS